MHLDTLHLITFTSIVFIIDAYRMSFEALMIIFKVADNHPQIIQVPAGFLPHISFEFIS